jgi:hypothetical protein
MSPVPAWRPLAWWLKWRYEWRSIGRGNAIFFAAI